MQVDLDRWVGESLRVKSRHSSFLRRQSRTEAGRLRILASLDDEGGLWGSIRRLNDALIAFGPEGIARSIGDRVGATALGRALTDAFCEVDKGLVALASRENAEMASLGSSSPASGEPYETMATLFRADTRTLKRARRDLAALACPKARLSVLGYGEISTVFELSRQGETAGTAYKKMPPFPSEEDLRRYLVLYADYHRVLSEEVGIEVPPFGARAVRRPDGRLFLYDIQPKFRAETIGNRVIRLAADADCIRLFRMILDRIRRLAEFNRRARPRLEVGLDGQISNWVVEGFDPARPRIEGNETLVYLDLSTPLMRREGREMLDTELFLKSVPSFLVWLVRLAFLKQVLDRYYDPRLVVVDLVANLLKEGRAEIVPALVREANAFFDSEMHGWGFAPLTECEIEKYYKNDAFIWALFQRLRRLDRFIRTRILGKPYDYRLPGRIER